MTDAEARNRRGRSQRKRSSQRDPSHPLPVWDGKQRDDAVDQLAAALRTAERAHRAYLAEL